MKGEKRRETNTVFWMFFVGEGREASGMTTTEERKNNGRDRSGRVARGREKKRDGAAENLITPI